MDTQKVVSGVLYVVGLTLFGKGVYELGKVTGQIEELERIEKFASELNESLVKIEEESH